MSVEGRFKTAASISPMDARTSADLMVSRRCDHRDAGPLRAGMPQPPRQRLGTSQRRPLSLSPATPSRALAPRLHLLPCTPSGYQRANALVGWARSAPGRHQRLSGRRRGATGIGGRLGLRTHLYDRSFWAGAVEAEASGACTTTRSRSTRG